MVLIKNVTLDLSDPIAKFEMTKCDQEEIIGLSFYKNCIDWIFLSSIVNFF